MCLCLKTSHLVPEYTICHLWHFRNLVAYSRAYFCNQNDKGAAVFYHLAFSFFTFFTVAPVIDSQSLNITI